VPICLQPEDRCSNGWCIIASLVLDGISSKHTRRAYSQALEEFLIWFQDEPGRRFDKAAVQKYRTELETKGLAASSINVRLSAIRRLAVEAADNGLMAPDVASGIVRAKGVRTSGVRLGHWLTVEQSRELLSLPDVRTLKGVRDRAVLALLVGAGLRRSEVTALDCSHLQQREGRHLIADLHGKHGRVRTIPVPDWAYSAIDLWSSTAAIHEGCLFQSVDRHGHLTGRRLSPQAIFMLVTEYGIQLGVAITPHDLRRTFAKLAHAGHSPIEQIQFSLGHASVVTTEVYLGTKQDLEEAPCDHLGLESAEAHSLVSLRGLAEVLYKH